MSEHNNEMKLSNAVVCWNVGGKVLVRKRRPFLISDSEEYERWMTYSGFPEGDAMIVLFADAMAMIVRDKCNPNDVHRELLKIDEYRQHMAFDCGGN